MSAYRRDLSRYVDLLAVRGVPTLREAGEADIAEFLARLREGEPGRPPLAASSAARAVVAVRGLHAFARREGLTPDDPARSVRPPTPPRRLP